MVFVFTNNIGIRPFATHADGSAWMADWLKSNGYTCVAKLVDRFDATLYEKLFDEWTKAGMRGYVCLTKPLDQN